MSTVVEDELSVTATGRAPSADPASLKRPVVDRHGEQRTLREHSVADTAAASSANITGTRAPTAAAPAIIPEALAKEIAGNPVASRALESFDTAQKAHLIKIFEEATCNATADERSLLAQGLAATLARNVDGIPALLAKDRTNSQKSLLDHLHDLACYNSDVLQRSAAVRRQEALRAIVLETGKSLEEVNQGVYNTCVPTVANRYLAHHQPAEYARIVTELLTTGRCLLYRDPEGTNTAPSRTSFVLELDPSCLSDSALKGRSVSESIFQESLGRLVSAYNTGMYADQAETVYEAAFGKAFSRIDTPAEALDALRATAVAGNPNMVSVKWASGGSHSNHALEVLALIRAEDIKGKSEIEVGPKSSSTKIQVTDEMRRALESGTNRELAILRNPWGGEYSNPSGIAAHTISKKEATLWMDSQDFASRINYALVPGGDFGVTPGGDPALFNQRTILILGNADEQQPSATNRPASKRAQHRDFIAKFGPTGQPGDGNHYPTSFSDGMRQLDSIAKSGPDLRDNRFLDDAHRLFATLPKPYPELKHDIVRILESGLPDEEIARNLHKALAKQSYRLEKLHNDLAEQGYDLRGKLREAFGSALPAEFQEFVEHTSTEIRSNFDATSAATALHRWISSSSWSYYEEGRVADILIPLSVAERRQLEDAYAQAFSSELSVALDKRFSAQDSRFFKSLLEEETDQIASGLAWSCQRIADQANRDENKKWLFFFLERHAAQSKPGEDSSSVRDPAFAAAYSNHGAGGFPVSKLLQEMSDGLHGSRKLTEDEYKLARNLLSGDLSDSQREMIQKRQLKSFHGIDTYEFKYLSHPDISTATAHQLRDAETDSDIVRAVEGLTREEMRGVARSYRSSFGTSYLEKLPEERSPGLVELMFNEPPKTVNSPSTYLYARRVMLREHLLGSVSTSVDHTAAEWRLRILNRNVTESDRKAWEQMPEERRTLLAARYRIFGADLAADLQNESFSDAKRIADAEAARSAAQAAHERWDREHAYVPGAGNNPVLIPSAPSAAPQPPAFWPPELA